MEKRLEDGLATKPDSWDRRLRAPARERHLSASSGANMSHKSAKWLSDAGTKSNSIINTNKNKKSEDDELGQLQHVIGNFGRYQFLIYMFKILIGVTSAFNNLGVTFFAPSDFIGFRCADPAALGQFNASSSSSLSPNSNISLYPTSTNILTPLNGSTGVTATYALPTADNAHAFYSHIFSEFFHSPQRDHRHQLHLDNDTPRNIRKQCKYLSAHDNQYHKCTAYEYDTGIWISTIIDEWNLVCDHSWFVSMTQSVYMSGFIVSFLVFGYISDRFGRWRSLMLGALIEVTSGFGCALANSVTWFVVCRFMLGLGNAGRTTSSYLIMIEWVGPKWRMHISTLGSMGWIIGYCILPWTALYFLHFRHLQLFICFYEMIFVIWLLFLPESPRWLLTHRRFDEARKVLLMAARFNGLIKDVKPHDDYKHQKHLNNATALTLVALDKSDASLHHLRDNTIVTVPNGPKVATRNKLLDVASTNVCNGATQPTPRAAQFSAFADKDGDSSTTESSLSRASTSSSLSDDDCHGLRPYTLDEFEAKFKRLTNSIEAKEFTANEDRLNVLDLFKWKNLRRYAMILFFVWASNSFIYYGIVLRVGDFGGKNLFVAFTIAGLTELPSIAFTILCMKLLPRRTTNFFIFTCVGLLCAAQLPLKYYDIKWLQQFTIMTAKLFNSCSFTVILYQTIELFPTSIRQTGYSSCSLAGRIGSILAPFVKELAHMTNESVPPVIYALLSVVSVILIKGLPETKGTDMPDTLLEAERFKGVGSGYNDGGKQANNMPSPPSTATISQPQDACEHDDDHSIVRRK